MKEIETATLPLILKLPEVTSERTVYKRQASETPICGPDCCSSIVAEPGDIVITGALQVVIEQLIKIVRHAPGSNSAF